MNSKLIALLIVGFFALSLSLTSISFVTAEDSEPETDEDGDNIDDEMEAENEREVEVEVGSESAQIHSKLKNGEQEDQIEVEIKPEDNGLIAQLNFQTESDSAESELQFKVEFRKLIEYVDQNSNGIFDDGVDNQIQELALSNFQAPVYTQTSSDDGTPIHYLKFITNDGVFTLHVFVAEGFASLDGATITPAQVKMDIEIDSFPYVDANSQLSLLIRLDSEQEYEHEGETEDETEGYASDEEAVTTSPGDLTGYFSWSEIATIDGVEAQVLSGSINIDDDDSSKQAISLNYPRGVNIYHDPKLGVEGILKAPPAPQDENGIGINTLTYALLAIALGSAILLIRRKKE